MYDWPEVRAGNDAFWAATRDALAADGVSAPEHLSRPDDLSVPWHNDGLLLGQTCGLPYVEGRVGTSILVARPSYDAEGCSSGTYRSALVARRDDPRETPEYLGGRAAVNEVGSQSGCNALIDAMLDAGAPMGQPLFGECVMSGAHRCSADLVAAGAADIAAIDAVAWALYALAEPERHARLRVVAWTRPMPALPFITSAANAGIISALIKALDLGARTVQSPAVPIEILPAEEVDYDPIRAMAERVRGTSLA